MGPRKRAAPAEPSDTEEPPTDIDPYATLEIDTTASADEVKKAYRKAALKHHPDKVPPSEAEAANKTFQRIALAYAILSSPARRRRYDATGSTSESILDDDDNGDAFDWLSFYRAQYADVVTEERINDFMDSYKGSEEEKQAIFEAFTNFQGDMKKLYESVMLSDVLVDDERFRGLIDKGIEDGELENWPKYADETESSKQARIKKAKKGVAEYERERAKRQKKKEKAETGAAKAAKGENSLLAMIQGNREQKRNDFLDGLEAKYAANGDGPGKAKGKKRKAAAAAEPFDEPPEEAFAAMAERAKKAKAR